MVELIRSAVDSRWLELREQGTLVQEIEILFTLKKWPRSFASVEEALQWLKEAERKRAKFWALKWLSLKSYPSLILFSKLKEKGFSQKISQEIVDSLEKLGLVEDRHWEKQEIARELRLGHGPRFIEAKWRAKGLSIASIREEISEEKQAQKIRDLWPKMSRKGREKGIRALVQRGFDLAEIFRVVGNDERI